MPLGVVARSGSYTLNRAVRSTATDRSSFLCDSSVSSPEASSSRSGNGNKNERRRDDFVLKTYATLLRSLYSCFDSLSTAEGEPIDAGCKSCVNGLSN